MAQGLLCEELSTLNRKINNKSHKEGAMFLKKLLTVGAVVSLVSVSFAVPEVSFGGFLDADVVSDFAGGFTANEELDLGMTLGFSEKVRAHLYATVWSGYGGVPAGNAPAADRWLSVTFDGFDLTFDTDLGTIAVGDLVFQYGKFDYYFYKRKSMITPESFTRGISYSVGGKKVTQTIMLGASDANNSTGDLLGSTDLTISDDMGISLYYGIKNDFLLSFKDAGSAFGGFELNSRFGDALSVKADVGLQVFGSGKKSVTLPLLLEPVLTLGDFSLAFTGYYMVDPDKTMEYQGAGEQMFAYMEPGYLFNDFFGLGLPLEIHSGSAAADLKDNGSFWAVPTAYVYPFEGTQWWFWYGLTVPLAEGSDMSHAVGSEIIVEF